MSADNTPATHGTPHNKSSHNDAPYSGTVLPEVTHGYRRLVIRNRWVSLHFPTRVLVTALGLLLLALIGAVAAITLGEYPLSLGEVFSALFSRGGGFDSTIVREWRLPIAVAAVAFGALLGVGGAIFQSLTRNPLGSPDVIGFDAGAYTAVVITMLVVGTSNFWAIAGASIVGGIITALVVYLLAWRKGVQGFRLIIVGIGVSAMLTSINSYLITRADVEEGIQVGFWAAGSITKVTWQGLVPTMFLGIIVVIAAAGYSRALRHLELGDDAATTQGFAVNRARLGLIVIGVATTALVTAAAGPISFIALVAPQIARRIMRTAGVSLLGAAAMGATLLTGAHILSLVIATFYRQIPVGLITVVIGGLYMLWLLLRESTRRYGTG
ncbi:MAG: iron-enterobactin ABC transporter permease [Corynebacterium propinquum]|uniref:FecCD family ABC transporter permease n=1 Tax=Corynebacterium propinquum TaxID=43769 RepID=UPI000DB61FBB|nr:iron chelate uptake ABC transporter family permease subunit [Corynebacterium propinquum]MDK4320400.1 iron chelate uptake ABC transporter family permease subunit [Corynebacterium propinquum]PZQ26237.1 MAG: iron-enterobactin ABC transporter permease [Corynebacterium propinquum]